MSSIGDESAKEPLTSEHPQTLALGPPNQSALAVPVDVLIRQLKQQFINWNPPQIREVRAIADGRPGLHGLCDSPESCAALIAKVPVGMNVYILMNPVREDAMKAPLGQLCRSGSGTCVGDADILHRTMFAMDFDPVRPKGVPATLPEWEASRQLAQLVIEFVTQLGWPAPTVMSSGNGIHLYWPCDLMVESELPKVLLTAVSVRFSTPAVKVDTVIFNAARIMRAAGTQNCKDAPSEDRPHRVAEVLSDGGRDPVLQQEHFLRVIDALGGGESPAPQSRVCVVDGFDLENFLDDYGIAHAGKQVWRVNDVAADKWPLESCPFDPSHNRREAAVFRMLDGTLGFKCHHNSCAHYHWKEFRQKVESRGMVHNRIVMMPFPIDCLPEAVRDRCHFMNETMGVPPGAIAASFLTALLAAVGNAARIKVWHGWMEQPGLWSALIAQSGRMKTAIQWPAIAPLYELESVDGVGRIISNDATIEGFAKLSQDSPGGLCLHMDEVASLVDRANQYRVKGGADLQFWIMAYEGRSYRVDRKKAENIYVPRLSASILGTIQPDVLTRQAQGQNVASGLFPRFLLTYLDGPRGLIRPPTSAEEEQGDSLHRRLVQAHRHLRSIPHVDGNPIMACCSPEAQVLIAEFTNNSVDKEGPQLELAMRDKSRGWAARIAGLLALMRTKDFVQPEVAIQAEDMARATQIVAWQLRENIRIVRLLGLGMGGRQPTREPAEVAAVLLMRFGAAGFTARDFYRTAGMESSEAAKALKELVAVGRLIALSVDAGPRGGHPTTRYVAGKGGQAAVA